ncbi:hypothetical protein [Gracilimonas halophila]|uniref:Uncharacterized protein n=1 Tax=Gracilimonas halophila TaxID=1834464 RepID=A0ABW5JFC4_9BACT
MKPLIQIALVLILASCATADLTMDGGYSYYGIDFREYTEQDFRFTTENPSGDYESVGIIEVEFYPEIIQITAGTYRTAVGDDNIWTNNGKQYTVQRKFDGRNYEYYAVEIFNTESLIAEMYDIATEWDANAVVNLRFENQPFNTGVYWTKVKVRGFAIREL